MHQNFLPFLKAITSVMNLNNCKQRIQLTDKHLQSVMRAAHKTQSIPLIRGSDWSSTTSLLRYRDDPSLFFCFFNAALWYGSILSTNLPDMIMPVFTYAVYLMICIKMEVLASQHKNTVPCATSTCWSYTLLGQKYIFFLQFSAMLQSTASDDYQREFVQQPVNMLLP